MSSRIPFDRIVLVHGFRASPDSHWYPWLAETLPGVERIALPESTSPRAHTWIPLVRDAIGPLNSRTAVVTHSLGGLTALRALSNPVPGGDALGALVAVAPFARRVPHTDDDELDAFLNDHLAGFLNDFEPSAVRSAIRSGRVVRSDDDRLVPAAISDAFANALGFDVDVVPGAGHFLGSDGVTTLAAVTNALQELQQPS